jgi:hypothetical protein
MKYPRDAYFQYKVFCNTVVLETKARMDTAKVGMALGTILIIVARALGVSLAAFIGISVLASAGALVYFGGIGAMLAANPVLAGILIGACGLGLGGIIKLVFRNRVVVRAVKEAVVDRYRGDFEHLVGKIAVDVADVPEEHVVAIDTLVDKGVEDLLKRLIAVGSITDEDYARLVAVMAKM